MFPELYKTREKKLLPTYVVSCVVTKIKTLLESL